jgi:phosphatidylglycerol:prolipoprotein diacylglycerol transferase
MFPYIHIGSFSLGTFGLFLWLAAVAAAWVLHKNFQRNQLAADAVSVVALVMLSGVLGAKAWHELQDPQALVESMRQIMVPGLHRPMAVLAGLLTWFRAGFAWYGGLAAGILMLMYQGRVLWDGVRVGATRMLDLAAPAAAIGYGVGRIGCLTSGDGDYGKNTTVPWGVHIRNDALDPPQPNPPGLLVHPTPIYELIFALILGWWLWKRGRKPLPVGWLTGEYLALSGIGRFVVEFWRRNPRLYWGMTNAQVAALLSVVAGALLMILAKKRGLEVTPEMTPIESPS